ncbi:flagellar motor switch protein FliG [Bremerella sp. T1]|uniref:flagellar motor switch protein FliG n=1 Tax=Bremerella sp. TYQ1 TaxID=3119568 RepID=UPI001CC90901|nr:flagellar motor switch protein FliG [Bremerella volcania]UBM37428.1 flagellar motor switch protein FliG [Bremerella volcania]
MSGKRDPSQHFSNPALRKAAIILMSLPEDAAAQLMGKLTPKQVELVCIEIAQLDNLSGPEQEAAILSFAEQNPNQLGGGGGGISLAKSLVTKALGKNATETLDNVRQSVESVPFGFLRKVDSQNLLTFIVDEHPQTIALILSHLPASYGAELISGLPAERQLSVIRRIANMGQTNPEVIREVERGLEDRMASVMSQSFENAGGIPSVAEILNVTDRTTGKALLENLSQEDPDLVEEIRRLMFVFDDIQKLMDKDIQAVLKNVETSQWAMALKGASQDLRDKIVGNMSKRAGEMLLEEMDFLGSVKLSEVEAVQQQIVDIVRRLEDAGEIQLTASDEEEMMIQ